MRVMLGECFNDADYPVQTRGENGKRSWCRYFITWRNMVDRAYDPKYSERSPTYRDVTICEEWKTFSNFKAWMQQQDHVGKVLEKDIIKPGNKIYRPDLCAFVDQSINNLIQSNSHIRGKYKIGVYFDSARNKFASKVKAAGKKVFVGRFDTEEEAFAAYKKKKLELMKLVADEQEPRVRDGIMKHAQLLLGGA